MDEYEKATRQVVEEFFDNFPELRPIRDLVEVEIGISYTLFFGHTLVLVAKASSKIIKEGKTNTIRVLAEKLLQKILAFLDNCSESESTHSSESFDFETYLVSSRVQASIYFTEGLYRAGEEYQAIVDLAPHKLKIDIARVEKYYGIPKADKQRFYRVLHNALRVILSEKKEDEG